LKNKARSGNSSPQLKTDGFSCHKIYKTLETSEKQDPVSQVDILVSVDSYNSDARDAARYRYVKDNMEWRRSGTLADNDSHAFVGCRFPYLANFECKSMLDYNIDKMINRLKY